MSSASTTAEDVFAPPEHHGDEDAVAAMAMGFWFYLMSDCVLFAALFAAFVVLSAATAGGPAGAQLFDLRGTLGETMLLLTSSMTCGLATLAMRRGARGHVLFWLAVTFLFGAGFVAMEVHEFLHMVATGAGPERSGFLSAFFALVGTHGTHVTVGLVWMLVMMVQVPIQGLTARVQSRLMRLGMFWHFLDIVWIGVFSVVYLRGML